MFQFSTVGRGIGYNGLGICDGAEIANRQLSFELKLNRITEVEHLMSGRTIANTLLAVVFYCLNHFFWINIG